MQDEPIPEGATIREKYGPAMDIEDEAEAKAYLERCIQHTMVTGNVDRDEAERIELINLGYFAGYCSHETRMRVQRLFGAKHPIFGDAGTPEKPKTPTMGQIVTAAQQLANRPKASAGRAELARIVDNEGLDYALRHKTRPYLLRLENDHELVQAWEAYVKAADAIEALLPPVVEAEE